VSGTSWLDSVLYGIDPAEAGPSSVPGAYDVSNGALVEFDDAYNVEAYELENDGALVPAGDLLGSSMTIADAFTTFFDQGPDDLLGYFGIFPSV
jgi:hypothetical protein